MGLTVAFYKFLQHLMQVCLSLSSELVGGGAPFTTAHGQPTPEQGKNVRGKEQKRETSTY